MGFRKLAFLVLSFSFLFCALPSRAQMGNSGSIDGVVKDPSGGIVAGATVEISYPVSGYQRETTTGSDGELQVHERAVEHVSPRGDNAGVRSVHTGRGCTLHRAYQHTDRAEVGDGVDQHNGGG